MTIGVFNLKVARNFIEIPTEVEVPYGSDNSISIDVRKNGTTEEKNLSTYHIGHNIIQRSNTLWTFTLELVNISEDDKDEWVKENNEILIFWGTQIRIKGRIEKIAYDNYERCTIEGSGMAVKLRDRDINEEYLNTKSETIVKKIVSQNTDGSAPWLMEIDTNTNYGLISMNFQTENKLKGLAGTVQAIDYDWWEDWKSADDYQTNYINIDDFKGDPTSTKTTLYTTGVNQNITIIADETDTYETTNFVTVLGYGDGVNQLKSISYHATDNRTTLTKPLDAVLDGAITGETETLTVFDSSGIDDGDTLRVDGESMTVTNVPSSTEITVAARTSKPIHSDGAAVIKTAGKIYCTDESVFAADTGNVWIGQEKISFSARDSGAHTLTIDSREAAFKNTNVVKAYPHLDNIEVEDAQYTEDAAEAGSYIDRDGVRSRTFTQTNVIDHNMLDYLAQRIRIDRQDKINLIKGEVTEAMEMLSTTNLQVGDWVELSDTYTGFNVGTRYEVVGLIYGFSLDRGEYCTAEISNYNATLLENTVKETDNLGKYYKGATNIYPVNDHDNCDGDGTIDSASDFPLVIPFPIPTDAVSITKVLLSYKIEDYRIYFDTDIPSGGGSTTVSGGGSTTTDEDAPGSVEDGGVTATSFECDGDWKTVNTFGPTDEGSRCIVHIHSRFIPDGNNESIDGSVKARIKSGGSYFPREDGVKARIYTNLNSSDGIFNHAHVYWNIEITEDPEDEDYEIQIDGDSDLDAYVYSTWQVVEKHTHDTPDHQHATPDHTHTVTYAISEISKSLTDVKISIDAGDGAGYVDRTVALETTYGTLSTSQEQDLDITNYIGRNTGWKGIRIHTDGKCRIRGDIYVKTFVQSTT